MLQKWKLIINNWINCYFDENSQDNYVLKIESLLNVISHLRENFDESKSSILEAHTIEEFILEKYPDFKFENGTALHSNEDDLYLVASLLLFFVCVNSKDVNIKNAMCSKLSDEDQKTILKFSKSLMECTPITFKHVRAAISDACGLNMSTVDTGHVTVAETPPVLRSLHSEVRRLHAALDAERFDRNYLQDELSRTNLKLEKLVKDKEQYKMEIVNLKSKLSLCNNGDHVPKSTDLESEYLSKLTRQLSDIEERLVRTQEDLDEAVYERDSFKTKIEELKQDRDKWLSLSQQESARVVQLSEELETERQHLQSLRELVTDLHQHNKLNNLDSSLECDDPDLSMPHNLSMCSEVCANVIEVQLSEEKAKVEALQQQIDILQKQNEQLHFLIKEDNSKHEIIIKEKDSVIDNLEQQLEEKATCTDLIEAQLIEGQTKIEDLKQQIETLQKEKERLQLLMEEDNSKHEISIKYKDSIIYNLEHQLKENAICAKVIEVQLTEEKANMDVLKKEIEQLQKEKERLHLIIEENNSKHETKLKEKDSIIDNLEQKLKEIAVCVEVTEVQLSKEKDKMGVLKQEIETLHIRIKDKDSFIDNLEYQLKEKALSVKAIELELSEEKAKMDALTQHIEILQKEKEQLHLIMEADNSKHEIKIKDKDGVIDNLKKQLQEKAICAEVNEVQLFKEKARIDDLKQQIETLQKENERLHFLIEEDNCKHEIRVKEKDLVIYKLEQQLKVNATHAEIIEGQLSEESAKMDALKHEIQILQKEREKLQLMMEADNRKHEAMVQEKDGIIDNLEHQLKEMAVCAEVTEVNLSEEKAKMDILKQDIEALLKENEQLHLIIEEDNNKHDIIIKEKDSVIESLEQQLKEKAVCAEMIEVQLSEEKDKFDVLKREIETINIRIKEKDSLINNLEQQLKEKADHTEVIEAQLSEEKNEIDVLKREIETLHSIIKEKAVCAEVIEVQLSEGKDKIDVLKRKIDTLNIIIKEKDSVINNLEQQLKEKDDRAEIIAVQLNEEKNIIDVLKQEIQTLDIIIKEKGSVIDNLQIQLKEKAVCAGMIEVQLSEEKNKMVVLKQEIETLHMRIKEKDSVINNLEQQLKEKTYCAEALAVQQSEGKDKMDVLKQEIETLHMRIKEKDGVINNLEHKLKEKAVCAGLMEVQLSEGKDKIEVLKQEIETLHMGIKEKNSIINNLEQQLKEKAHCAEDIAVQLSEGKVKMDVLKQEIETLHMRIKEKHGVIDNLEHQLQEKADRAGLMEVQLSEGKDKIDVLKQEIETLYNGIKEKDSVIDNLERQLKEKADRAEVIEVQLSEEKYGNNVLKQEIENINIRIKEKDSVIINLQQQLKEKADRAEVIEVQLSEEKDKMDVLKQEIETLHISIKEKDCVIDNLEHQLKEKAVCAGLIEVQLSEGKDKIDVLKQEIETLHMGIKEKDSVINNLEQQLKEKTYCAEAIAVQLSEGKDKMDVLKQEIETLHMRIKEKNIVIDNLEHQLQEKTTCAGMIEVQLSESESEKDKMDLFQQEIKSLQSEQEQLRLVMEENNNKHEIILKEKYIIINNLEQQLKQKVVLLESVKRDYENMLTQEKNKLNAIEELRQDRDKWLSLSRQENARAVQLSEQLATERQHLQSLRELITDLHEHNKLNNLDSSVESDDSNLSMAHNLSVSRDVCVNTTEVQPSEEKARVDALQQQIETLQKENEQLHSVMDEDNSKHDIIMRQKDSIIDNLEHQLKEKSALLEIIKKYQYEDATVSLERHKLKSEGQTNSAGTGLISWFNKEVAVRSQENAASQKNSRQLAEKDVCDIYPQVDNTSRHLQSVSSQKNSGHLTKDVYELHHQIDNTSDMIRSSMESLKTISDLERIIHDKNRTITSLQSDITYLKTLMADSETKLLDVTKELEISRENCQQLSSQLKKIVYQKNDEITDLKKQVNKMSATESRATQIIKVSAKYQAIILKRIAEIKTNTVLKELTNYTNNCDNDLKRTLTAGSISMEDLENFLETTERHIKKCTEKQIILQKERDRLTEVNRINESEIINLKKFLTELSVSFQTFSSVKDLYAQKLSRVISIQRTVRREILNLDGHITDACMLKLERGYAAVMQDLSECAMNLERWVESCIGRTISSEKIKRAFMNYEERSSLAPSSVKNAGLEVQLDELEKSFQKLLEEVSRAQKGEGARDAQAITVMEVRAEYEDKLNRMKAKMKQLYAEQIAVFKEKQKEEIAILEKELIRAREELARSSQRYEEHIRRLTSELWTVGEKFLRQKNETDWLRRKQYSGSLMSLQHVHSSGLVPMEDMPDRPSDTHSLRSLPVNNCTGNKRESRGLHMSDEDGEVFDNRFLKDLATTPRREPAALAPGQRLSELQWRNSLCPPHLKSSYPAETQFTPAMDEDEIKAMGNSRARIQRKEVGITAYKKPGPPTPSKQAGRLSATDSELRESLRVEARPQPSRKASTPSRIRSLFRQTKNDTSEGTPRTRRLSNIFRKKI